MYNNLNVEQDIQNLTEGRALADYYLTFRWILGKLLPRASPEQPGEVSVSPG